MIQAAPTYQNTSIRRLVVGFTLLQIVAVGSMIVSVSWIVVFWSDDFDWRPPVVHWIYDSTHWIEVATSGVLLASMYLLTRRLERWLPFLAGWLLFLGALRSFLLDAMYWAEWYILSDSDSGAHFVKAFAQMVRATFYQVWEPVQLSLMVAGFVLAFELNRKHSKCLATRRRMWALLILAAAGSFSVSVFNIDGAAIWVVGAFVLDDSAVAALASGTIAVSIVETFCIAFSLLLFLTLKTAKRRLRVPPGMMECMKCGYLLAVQTTRPCPECGRVPDASGSTPRGVESPACPSPPTEHS